MRMHTSTGLSQKRHVKARAWYICTLCPVAIGDQLNTHIVQYMSRVHTRGSSSAGKLVRYSILQSAITAGVRPPYWPLGYDSND